ncbi:MAG: NAD-dependent epimerase/dehydratase family protein [Henriciella sp.]
MRTLVLGVGGMIGDAVAASLTQSGHEVFCVSRSAEPVEDNGVVYKRADRNDPDQIALLVNTLGIDVVVDVIAYDTASTQNLLALLAGKIDQYVLLSSCDVYRNYGLIHQTEMGAPDPSPLREDSPIRSHLYPYRLAPARRKDDPQRWLDDYDKIPIEAAARTFDGKWTILRLPMVYGPGDPQKRFEWAIRPLLAGAETIVVPASWLNWTTTYGYVGNVASAIAASVGNSDFENRTFNVVDREPKPHREWLSDFAKLIGWSGQVTETDDPNHPISVATSPLDLKIPLLVSGQRMLDFTTYRPTLSHQEALRNTIAA